MHLTCSLCCTHYPRTPEGRPAFCSSCLESIAGQVSAVAEYRRRIAAGDRSVIPENDRDALEVKRAIRRGLTSSPDARRPA